MLSTFTTFVHSFSQPRGIESKTINSDYQYTLVLHGFPINLVYLESRELILFQSGVALLPEKPSQAFFTQLLQANNLFSETSGCTLGLDAEQGMITLQVSWPMHQLNQDGFDNVVENFLMLSAQWMQTLAQSDYENDNEVASIAPSTDISVEHTFNMLRI